MQHHPGKRCTAYEGPEIEGDADGCVIEDHLLQGKTAIEGILTDRCERGGERYTGDAGCLERIIAQRLQSGTEGHGGKACAT